MLGKALRKARFTAANQASLLIYLPNTRTALFGGGLPMGTGGALDATVQLLGPSGGDRLKRSVAGRPPTTSQRRRDAGAGQTRR